jgi:hypothetical protein
MIVANSSAMKMETAGYSETPVTDNAECCNLEILLTDTHIF